MRVAAMTFVARSCLCVGKPADDAGATALTMPVQCAYTCTDLFKKRLVAATVYDRTHAGFDKHVDEDEVNTTKPVKRGNCCNEVFRTLTVASSTQDGKDVVIFIRCTSPDPTGEEQRSATLQVRLPG